MTLAEDGTENKAMIAPDLPDAHQFIGQQPNGAPPGPISPAEAQKQQEDPETPDPAIIFNPNVGTYDVEADVGPAYGTQRQEAANAFSQIMQQNPAAFQIVGDFWAANSDFPNADELAERLKRGLPPQYKAGPDPQVMAVTQQAQQMQQQAQGLLQKADAEIASLKAQLVHAQEQAKDKSAEIEIKVRQMVSDMLQTEIHPVLQQHAADESELQQTLAPPVPVNGANGQAPSGPAPGGGGGP
jgi:hypothetical protein